MLSSWLQEQARDLQMELTDTALMQLATYLEMLQEWNKKMNLTSVDDAEQVYEIHFLDSLSVHLAVDLAEVNSLIDVGTGAGFPGLVLAVAWPHLQVTLLESVHKKARFLQELVEKLQLQSRVEVVVTRAEAWGQAQVAREQYDVAVARAVARLNVLSEYCLPLVRLGGFFVAQKGPQAAEELAEAERAIDLLGGAEPKVIDWRLPSGAERVLLRVKKLQPTPSGYPRRIGLPNKRPLV